MRFLYAVVLMVTQFPVCLKGQCIPNPNVTPGPNDPPFPSLPPSFMTKLEANLKDEGKTVTAEEYYSQDKQSAALKIISNGKSITQLFDYKNDQLFLVDQFKHCEVMNLSLSSETILFGTADQTGGLPHIFSTNGVLHFMQQSGQVYKGRHVVRGVNTDHWSTCLQWKQINSTFTLDYYFTVQEWQTPIAFPQIPVRAIATGLRVLPNGTNHQFQHFYEYIDFRIDFDDYSVFGTPKGVYCPGRKSNRNITSVTPSFHVEIEVVSPESQDISYFAIWYDTDLQLMRKDYRPLTPSAPLFTTNPLSEVHDFTTGVKYITDKVTGNCTIKPITNSDNDADTGSYGEFLKNPQKYLFMDAQFQYSGLRMARGVPCDVFTAQRLFPFKGNWYNATLDYYLLSTSYKEHPFDGTTTPTALPVRLEAYLSVPDMDDLVIAYNFLSYDTAKRSVSDYHISACYRNMSSLRFQVRLPGPFQQQDTDLLKLQAERVLPSVMNITYIRLQDLRVDFDVSAVYLTCTLVNIAPDYAKFSLAKLVQNPTSYTTSPQNVNRSYNFVAKWQDCATYCIQNFDFVCNSFDYCPNPTNPGNGNCHLYKDRRTDIQTYLQSHTAPCVTFSVYQRTVAGVSNQETAVADAYGYLQDAINLKSVHIQTFDQNGLVTDYYPVEVDILSGVLEYDDMPSMTGQFSFRQEITFPVYKHSYASQIYYDYNFKLARYDMVKSGAPYYSDNPLSSIYDYSTGVVYTIDTGLLNCSINPLSQNSLDIKQNGSYQMLSPLEIFHMNRTYKFIGQKTVRGMTCNIFEATVNNFKVDPNDPEVITSTFQYYFLKDDWQTNSDSSFGTASAQPIRLDISSVERGLYITFHYFDWNNHDPDISNFNTLPCYTGDQRKEFAIVFSGQYYPYLQSNIKYFKLQVHNMLSMMTNASFIRFQQPQITYGLSTVYVIMTVVDPAPTFDGVPYVNEPDKDAVLDAINDNIYRGVFKISVPQTDGTIYTFNATGITDNILRNDGKPLSSKTLSHFKALKDKSQKGLSGFLSGISVDECAESCLTELEFDCYSYVYCYNTGTCLLAKTYAQSRPDLVYDRPNCDLYYRSYLDKFTAAPGQVSAVSTTGSVLATTDETCAQQCLGSNTCKSFLYCQVAQTCSLLQTHHLDVQKTSNNTDAMCTFYSRSYVNDFKYKSRSTIQFTQVLDIEAVSVDQCAELCIQTEAFNCNSFAFCGNSTTCRLTQAHPSKGARVIAKDYCDLYTRKDYVAINKAQTQSSSKGYTAGTVAGVAVALLVIGIILGVGLVFLYNKKKTLPPTEVFNMNYTDMKNEQ